MAYKPIRFIDQQVEVTYDREPVRQKTPSCPDGFSWEGREYRVVDVLAEWKDFTRRGRMARNMSPAHAAVAERRGSLGVGKFYFRVLVHTFQVFDLYYDRAPQDADRRKGAWFLFRELSTEQPQADTNPAEG